MQLKEMLRHLHTDARKLVHGRLLLLEILTTSFWHFDAVEGRPLHHSVMSTQKRMSGLGGHNGTSPAFNRFTA
jgi:hypothetical protein